jgi:hypothetical protein
MCKMGYRRGDTKGVRRVMGEGDRAREVGRRGMGRGRVERVRMGEGRERGVCRAMGLGRIGRGAGAIAGFTSCINFV